MKFRNLIKYTIHLQDTNGHTKPIQLFAESLPKACKLAKSMHPGYAVSMAWHNYPIIEKKERVFIELKRSK